MKKIVLTIFIASTLLSSCSDEHKLEASEAENVEIVENETTIEFNSVDKTSSVEWRAWHFGGVGERFGKIYLNKVSALLNNDELTNLKVEIDMSSFTVDSFSEEEAEDKEQLTGHLQSADFFDVENYPIATFEMTDLKANEGEYNSIVTGNLTIMETTKSISFKANVDVSAENISIHSEDFIVNRTDWGLTYHVEGSEGVPLDFIISDDLGFTINVNIKK